MKCSKCGNPVERVVRAGTQIFWLCRPCKMPHDENGTALLTDKELVSQMNFIKRARDTVTKSAPHAGPVARTSLEVAMVGSLMEAYKNGMRDGVLLAYSQDIEDGDPLGE